MAARPYDIVVFGSSGFTGEFVNEELYRIQNEGRQDLKWAAAGRNLNKLEDSLKGICLVTSVAYAHSMWLDI